ncbi:MAG: hypothetical protein ABR589_03160 [Chthoniobacterales bacterium]
MKMRTVILTAIVLLGFWLAPSSRAQTTVRGQLLRNGEFPASGVTVTIYSQMFGRSSPSQTGGDGMYYIYNVPFGDYYLEIWISNPPRAYPVRISGFPYHDLPRLPVP